MNFIMLIFAVSNKKGKSMKKFEVIMQEIGRDGKIRILRQTAYCESEEDVIKWYGLNEKDIVSYSIKEL